MGVSGSGTELPYLDAIQASFRGHDVAGVTAHTDGAAAQAAAAMGAQAYATGDAVAFADGAVSLHTAAHEAAHVVQQRAGVSLSGGVGQAGDPYERHADAVADLVVQGKSAEGLLDQGGGAPGTQSSVQYKESAEAAAVPGNVALTQPVPMVVTATKLRVRSTRDTSSDDNVIGQLTANTRVDVWGKEGDWLVIHHQGTRTYIHGFYARPVSAPGEQAATGSAAGAAGAASAATGTGSAAGCDHGHGTRDFGEAGRWFAAGRNLHDHGLLAVAEQPQPRDRRDPGQGSGRP